MLQVHCPARWNARSNQAGTGIPKNERAARAALHPILDAVNKANISPAVVEKSEPTSRDAAAEWRSLAAVNRKPQRRETAGSHLRTHILPELGGVKLSELDQKTIQNFVAEITPGRNRSTVESVALTLSGILNHARKWHKNVEKFRVPEKVKAKPRFLSAKGIRKLIAKAEKRFKTILLTLALTGMRIHEVLGLRVEDIDFEERVIHVTKSAYNGTLGTPKSKANEANIPLSTTLEEALRKHLASEHCRESPLGVLFADRRLGPYSDNKLRAENLRPLLKFLGMKQVGFHAIRHTVASELINSGTPITVVRDQMRHSDMRVTSGIYGHVIGDAQRKAVEKLAKKMIA